MKRLSLALGVLLFCGGVIAQTNAPRQVDPYVAPTPPYPTSFTCGTVGVTGNTSYYYWVVAIHPAGHVPSPAPFLVATANSTLDGSNYVTCAWNNPAPAGITMTYALLRSTTPSFPGVSGSAQTVAVTASTSSLTANDQSNTLNAYTFSPAVPANARVMLDNQTSAKPIYELLDGSANPNLQVFQTSAGVNGLKLTTGATGTGPTVSSGNTGSDTNTPLNVTSKGTGNINLQTGDGARTQAQILDTAGTIVNNVTFTGAATAGAPAIGATGSDGTVALNFKSKSTGVFQFNGAQVADSTGALGGTAAQQGNVYAAYGSATVAQINTGQTILADVAGRTVKIVGFMMQAIGGAAATCTAVQIADSSAVVGVSVAVAGLTQNTVVEETAGANVTLTTFLTGLTSGKGLVLQKTGSSCATMTSMNYRVLYTYI